MPGATLIKPRPVDASKSLMENVLELTPLKDVAPDLFTNSRELWHPPGARGVYGGAVIAQCLSAALSTLPSPSSSRNHSEYLPHSMHCFFVLAGDSTIPILYHVERVRDGKSFVTRTVQARQRGKCIFTTTISFMLEGSGGLMTVEHGWDMPKGAKESLEEILKADRDTEDKAGGPNGVEARGPFISKRMGLYNQESPHPHTRKPQQWLQCRGQISPAGGLQAHLSALAYMSDSWFIGTVSRVHGLDRFSQHLDSKSGDLRRIAELEHKENTRFHSKTSGAQIGMMVSLDHTIYFHRPREVRADEWMFSEMETPWSGEGRGLVMQRIWNKEGRLVASCVQEGLVRLKPDEAQSPRSRL